MNFFSADSVFVVLGLGIDAFCVAATCCCAITALRQCFKSREIQALTGREYTRETQWQNAIRVPAWVLCVCGFGFPIIMIGIHSMNAYEEVLRQAGLI